MADSPTYGTGLIDTLRVIIKDTAWDFGQFEFSILTGSAALVEVSDTAFKTTTTGGPTALNLDLSSSSYATIELLVNHLNTLANTSAQLMDDADPHHASADLAVMVPTVCLNSKVILKSRRFSDEELTACVTRAIQRHNMNVPIDESWTGLYTINTLPAEHQQFVLLLAQIEVLKTQVMDGVKRRGLDLSPEAFATLRQALEDEYDRTLTRWLSAKHVVAKELQDDIGSGVIVEGTLRREREVTGNWPWGRRMTPGSQSQIPAVATLSATVLGAGLVRLVWTRTRDLHFHRYELWRHTTNAVSNISDVVRPAGAIAAAGEKVRTEYQPEVTNWVDGASTPLVAGTYYYRIYVFNNNNDQAEGAVVTAVVT